MPGAARVGDVGQGICHYDHSPQSGIQEKDYITTFLTGANSVIINGNVACIVNTVGDSTCGHPTTAETGSPTVIIEGSPAHRIGDAGDNGGPYTVVSGSSDVIID